MMQKLFHFLEIQNTKFDIKTVKKIVSCDQTPAEFQAMRKLKPYETIQEPNQLTRVTRLPADAFMFIGNIYINKTKKEHSLIFQTGDFKLHIMRRT